MRRRLFATLFVLLMITGHLFAQLSGTRSIPGDYPSIAAAIAALNAQGAGTGGITFNISPGYVETFATPEDGLITTQTGSGLKPIVFRKNGTGVNPRILSAGGIGNRDYIIGIQGADYVTFDGIDVMDNPINGDNSSRAEYGYFLMKAPADTSGAQYCAIKHCRVTLNSANTEGIGIYIRNYLFNPVNQIWFAPILKNSRQTNSFNLVQGNYITDCFTGIRLDGYGLASLQDDGNTIDGDTITNFGGTSGTANGIYAQYENNMLIANNFITGTVAGGTCYGMQLQSSQNTSIEIAGNKVSINYLGTFSFNAIRDIMGAGGTSIISVHDNLVTGCTFPNATSSTCEYLYIGHGGPNVSVYNNSVVNNQYGSASTNSNGSVTYLYVAFYPPVLGTANYYNNTVKNNTRLQSPSGVGGMTSYMKFGGQCLNLNCYGNVCDSNTSATTGEVRGIECNTLEPRVKNIYGNSFTNLFGANGNTFGIYLDGGYDWNLYGNKVQNITGSGSSSTINGIYIGNHDVSGNLYMYNNIVGDLKPGSAQALTGIWVYGYNTRYAGIYNNTVYMNGSSTAANFGSSGLRISKYCKVVDLRNNIIVNASTPNGTGKTIALQTDTLNFANLTAVCNNNNFYAGTPSAQRLIASDGTNNDQTLLQFKSRVYPREFLSVTENPPFVSVSTPMNLHIGNSAPTQCESAGTVISSPIAVTTDYDGNPRYPNAGYPVHPSYPAKAPDIGADEFGGIPNDQTPPYIAYTPLANIATLGNRVLTATITDVNGVPTSGDGLPRLCWKKNAGGTWTYVTGTSLGNSQYSFVFGDGAVIGDVVYYFVVAQDMWPTPNVGPRPFDGAGGYTSNPPAVATPPSTPESYTIVAPICGTFTVGTGGNYPTITAAVNDINSKGITCPVTLVLTNSTYYTETLPITLQPNGGSSSINTLTIKPATGVHPMIAGAGAGIGIFKLNGFDYLVIDGSATGGNDKGLTIYNYSETAGAHTIGLYNKNNNDPATHITIKNCVLRGIASTTVTNYGIYLNPEGGAYDNITITGDSIYGANTGIEFTGHFNGINHNGAITGNVIGSKTAGKIITVKGIQLSFSDNTLIERNDIMGDSMGNAVPYHYGIKINSGTVNTKISRNLIHDFYRNVDDGFGAYGIWYEAESSSVTEISNNSIYGIKSSGAAPGVAPNNPYGIFIASGGNIRILHNSIWLYGNLLSPSGVREASSSCIGILGDGTLTNNIEVRNNILSNTMLGLNGMPCSLPSRTLCIATRANNAGNFSVIDNNVYNPNGCTPRIGMMNYTEYQTIFDWRAATGQDVHSLNADPLFTSPSYLFPTASGIGKAGAYISSVPADIVGITRTNPPDAGAYEFTPSPQVLTTPATNVTAASATLNGTINPANYTVSVYFDYGLSAAYGNTVSGSPSVISGGSTLPVTIPVTGLLESSTYHFRVRGITFTGLTVYGNDLTFTTSSSVPVNTTVTGTVGGTTDTCYNAQNVITVAGGGSTFTVQPTAHVRFIAGQMISFLPGTTVQAGGYMWGRISAGEWCTPLKSAITAAEEGRSANAAGSESAQFVIYPNPTTGNFTLAMKGDETPANVVVEVYTPQGRRIISETIIGEKTHDFAFREMAAGLYLVKVVTGGKVETLKVVKL